MSRNKEPTVIQLLKGVDKKNPKRVNKNEPRGNAIGSAPRYFSKEKKKIWNEIKSELVEGVLQKSDRRLFAELCELVYLTVYDRKNLTSSERKDFISLASKFGMSASDRSKITIPIEDKHNPFDEFT